MALCVVAVTGFPPGKLQAQAFIGSPAGGVEPSVKPEGEFKQALELINPATGSGLMSAGSIVVLWHPLSEVAVSITVKGPKPVNR